MDERTCYCSTCAACAKDFKKVINQNSSELVIYQNRNKSDQISFEDPVDEKNTRKSKILKSEHLSDLRRCRTRCGQCKKIIEKVRSLLDELVDFKEHGTIGICEHCRRTNTTTQCKRCDYIVTKFISEHKAMINEKQKSYKTWLLKVKTLLKEIQKSHQEWDYMFYKDVELEGILKQLEVPLAMRIPNIDYFPHVDEQTVTQILSDSKELLSDILNRIHMECKNKRFSSEDSLYPLSSMHKGTCICKLLKVGQLQKEEKADNDKGAKIVKDELYTKPIIQESEKRIESKTVKEQKVKKGKEDVETRNIKNTKDEIKSTKDEIKSTKGEIKSTKEQRIKKETIMKKNSDDNENTNNHRMSLQIPKLIPVKTKRSEASEAKNVKTAKDIEDRKAKALALLSDLPQIQIQTTASSTTSLESFVECDNESHSHKYFIKGNSLKPYREYKAECTLPPLVLKEMESKPLSGRTVLCKDAELLPQETQESPEAGGLIYRLSNPEFINKGWTKLPTKKIMRRMNIYKMHPVKQRNNWLERLQKEKIMYYDSGEIFSKIDEFGSGKIYYRNGSLALEYYRAQEMYAGRRFVVYSSGDENLNGYKARTILAIFDYLGNGVIYDLNGNIRLKYNQSEGIVIDSKIGPPARWKWHTLNEPPVIEQVFIDQIDRTQYTNDRSSEKNDSARVNYMQLEAQNAMLQIELDNIAKAKLKKMAQNFQPLQIKMKAAKLNDNFSVRILDQSNISLVYRDGTTNFKLNLGMNLNSREIIDTQIFKIGDVATPYDDYPARSQSVENIQQALNNIRKRNKRPSQRKLLKDI